MAPASSGAGYSGTPLGKKLSLKPGLRVWFDAMPDSVLAEIDMPDLVYLVRTRTRPRRRTYLRHRTR